MADRHPVCAVLAGGVHGALDFDRLVQDGRRANLLGRLAVVLADRGALATLDARIRRHFDGALFTAKRQADAVRWEVSRIQAALRGAGLPTLLLKGAAYVLAGLPPARGRTMSDIDILVPHAALADAESVLMRAGWTTTHHDPYDQRYYREWTHELPPMRHMMRGSVIDVHHALLPVTARLRVDSDAMRRAAVPVPGHPELRMLAPLDMVLHAACHLFHEGELNNGLRDLSDLDLLLRHFGRAPEFWTELLARARQVGLERPLFYALRYTRRLLDTPVLPAVLNASEAFGPAAPVRALMDGLYLGALPPRRRGAVKDAVDAALFVRGHWLRMRGTLLVRHIAHKAWTAVRPEPPTTPTAPR